MKIHLNYIIFLFLTVFIGNDLMAQNKASEKSEIVMRQSELDSLLTKIAKKKKEQLAKQRESQKRGAELNAGQSAQKNREEALEEKPKNNGPKGYSDQISREFYRLNQRIDWMVMNMNRGSNTPVIYVNPNGSDNGGSRMLYNVNPNSQPNLIPNPQGNTLGNQPSPNRISPQQSGRQSQPNNNNQNPQERDSTVKIKSNQLQSQIDELNEKIRVLDTLGTMANTSKYDNEIKSLKGRIDELQKEKNELKSKDDELKGHSQTIYFANNSKSLDDPDKKGLKKIADLVKESDSRVVVTLNGFASKSGSAQYNNKLSFERANAVKNILLQNGLKAKNIITFYHGADPEEPDKKARRVEVSLRAY